MQIEWKCPPCSEAIAEQKSAFETKQKKLNSSEFSPEMGGDTTTARRFRCVSARALSNDKSIDKDRFDDDSINELKLSRKGKMSPKSDVSRSNLCAEDAELLVELDNWTSDVRRKIFHVISTVLIMWLPGNKLTSLLCQKSCEERQIIFGM